MKTSKPLASALILVFLTISGIIVTIPVSAAFETENTWVEKAPMHVARGGLGVAVVNGQIYAIGGESDVGVTGINEVYNSTADAWTYRTSMPTPRIGFAIVAYQNKIYCIGGQSVKAGYTAFNEVYDVATDTWTTKTSMPTARTSLSANVIDGKIYVIGGVVYNSSAPPTFSSSTLNEVYDPATDSWITRARMPSATSSGASTVVEDKIYIVGGLESGPAGYSLNQIYNPKTDTWKLGATPPSGIAYGVAGATTGTNAPKRIYFVYDGTQVYDPMNDSWGFGANMPTKHIDFGVAIVNDTLFAIGGLNVNYAGFNNQSGNTYNTTYSATVEKYTPFGYGTLQPSPTPAVPEFSSLAIPLLLTIIVAAGLLIYHKKHKRAAVLPLS